MPVHIIIDGYNLIHQSRELNRLHQEDIQSGREALLESLAVYKRLKSHQITVVFDGKNAPHFSPKNDQVKGIAVRFSRRGETADAIIKRMAKREREKALIVSSDRDVTVYSSARGAATVTSSEFEEKMMMAAYMDIKGVDGEEGSGWTPTTKKKGPSRRRSKRERRNRSRIRKL
ncbi:NYN domain-containing protein [Thermodesulfobacteriota bacterium]